MRLRAGCLFLAVCVAAPLLPAHAQQADAPRPWSLSLDSEVRIVSWRGDRGSPLSFAAGTPGRGSQIYAPTSLSFVWNGTPDWSFDLLVRSGLIHSEQNTGGGLVGTATSLSDTSTTGRISYSGFGIFQPFLSLGLNLPTGRTILNGASAFTRMDPDLVEVASSGEGFNVGPTVGFTLALAPNASLTASVGQTVRGAYDRDSVLGPGFPLSRIKPSDSTSYNLQLMVRPIEPLTLSLAALYSRSAESRLNGFFTSRSGDFYSLNGSVAYDWEPQHTSTLAISWSNTQRNLVLDAAALAIMEPFNSNSSSIRIALDHSFKFDERWTFGVNTSWFQRDRNSYNPTDNSFSPAKTRFALGASVSHQLTEAVSLRLRAEHYWLHESFRPDVIVPGFGAIAGTGIPNVNSTGLMVSLGTGINF
jgi:hypothetical protein